MSPDADVVALADEARRADVALRVLLAEDSRDTDQIPSFTDGVDASSALVDRVCTARAVDLVGLIAKARLAEHFGRHAGDKGARLALSVVRDLLALSDRAPI